MLRPNLSLCVGRAGSAADNQEWNVVFVADTLVDMNLFYRGGNVNYPLHFAPLSGGLSFDRRPRPNFKPAFLSALAKTLALPQSSGSGLPAGWRPKTSSTTCYAVFHSPTYRTRYAEFLKIDFPRLPLTCKPGPVPRPGRSRRRTGRPAPDGIALARSIHHRVHRPQEPRGREGLVV